MKILVITDKLYPDEYGGSCTVAYELIKEWQKNNRVDIFTCKKTKTSNDKLFKNNVYRMFLKKNPIYSAMKLKKILKNVKYDVIVTHSVYAWFIYYITTFLVKEKTTENLFAIFHGPWHKEAVLKYKGNNNKIKQTIIPKMMFVIEWLYCKKNNNFIFLSKYMQQELASIDKQIKDKNCYFIPGGVDLSNYKRQYEKEEAKSLLGIEKNKCVLFTLRRLDKRMGIDNLIEALKLMTDEERKQYILLIGGKGDYRKILEQKAENIKENVVFAGFIPDKDLNKYFCATDLFVVPTLDLEGFGLVNLESLAMGVPVIATPQGGMLELGESFRHFHLSSENSALGLKKAIFKYRNIYLNKTIKENISVYDWKNIAKKYIEVFLSNKII